MPVQEESLNSGVRANPRSRRITQQWGWGQPPFKKNHSTVGFGPSPVQEESLNSGVRRTRRVFGMVGRWSPMVQCQPQEFQSITSYPPYTIIYGRALFLCPNRPTKMATEFSSEHHLPVTRVAVGFLEGFGIVVCAVWSSSCLVVNQLHFLILNPISGNGLKPLTTLI